MAITYSIDGGADAAKFNINATSGALTFKAAPDFEQPGDANGDNIYEVSVKATDATGLASSKLVKVTVTDVSEGSPPQITSAGAISIKENSTTVMTVTATDPDDTTQPPIEPPPTGEFTWPNATNTGVPAGTNLTAYTGPTVISAANTVVDSKNITQAIEVTATGVTFRKCKFTANNIWQLNGDTAKNLTIEDCEFSSAVGSTNTIKSILGQGNFTRLNMFGTCIAITLKGGQSNIKNCYIHDLKGPSGTHFDGIFIAGDQTDCLVKDNLISIPQQGGTSAIFIATRWQGADIVNTTVDHNRLLGKPSYAMYAEQTSVATISGTKWLNNEVERGAYGYWTITGTTVVKTGNKDAFTGASIDSQ